jgi:hypothetical protein
MSHRFIPALLCTLALAAVPATASAQAPTDERANARAFADVGIQLMSDIDAAGTALDDSYTLPNCKSDRRIDRATEGQQARAFELILGQLLGQFGRATAPAFDRANAALAAVPTADPALVDGRTAWRQVANVYATFGKLRHVRLCIELRNYVRHDFKPTRAMRRTAKAMRKISRMDLDGLEGKLAAATDRLVELGVPKDEAAPFNGLGGDESDGADYQARAAQVPAPSSPLKLLRAAS